MDEVVRVVIGIQAADSVSNWVLVIQAQRSIVMMICYNDTFYSAVFRGVLFNLGYAGSLIFEVLYCCWRESYDAVSENSIDGF